MSRPYEIAIPSYQRAETLRDKTMMFLERTGYDPQLVTVFVADEEERDKYSAILRPDSYRDIVVAAPGIRAVRNFISRYYPEGTKVFGIDDDIRDIVLKIDDKNLQSMPSVDEFVKEAFGVMSSCGAKMWGIYPVPNPLFMKARVVTRLCYIAAGFYGWVSTHDDAMMVELDDKEDFERSIKFYQRDGLLLRIEYASFKTACYSEPGGMQVERTEQRVAESARYLAETYPQFCRMNNRKKSKWAEVELKDMRHRISAKRPPVSS